MTRARLISDVEEIPQDELPPPPKTATEAPAVERHATEMLMIALSALSKRFVVAVENLFTLLTAASVFWIWHDVLQEPDILRLIGAGAYSIFILALNRWGRRPQPRLGG